MAGDIHDVTHLSSVSLFNTLTVGAASLTTAGRLAMGSGTSVVLDSGSTLDFGSASLSIASIGAHSSLASLAGSRFQVGVIMRASGVSLLLRSANSIYYFNSDASGAA